MQHDVTLNRDHIKGKRINATPESDIPAEDLAQKQLEREKQKARSKVIRGRVFAVIGTVFLWLPLIAPVPFYIHNAINDQRMPFLLYPILVLAFRFSANIGSLFLYLASRAVNAFRQFIGWSALSILILPNLALIMAGTNLYAIDPAHVSRPLSIIALALLAITILGMLALNVASILLLRKAFQPPGQSSME